MALSPPSNMPAAAQRRPLVPLQLAQVLRRADVWRGYSHAFVPQPVQDSGHAALNRALNHGGWPLSGLIEICQPAPAGEWLLLAPALVAMGAAQASYIALLNPPALPFVAGLRQQGIDSERVLVIMPGSAQDLLACFAELCQSPACQSVLAWQGNLRLSYTQLRKLQLQACEQPGLAVLFRPLRAQAQSSPASLRLSLLPQRTQLALTIFKQKGAHSGTAIHLPLPPQWQALPPHEALGEWPRRASKQHEFR